MQRKCFSSEAKSVVNLYKKMRVAIGFFGCTYSKSTLLMKGWANSKTGWNHLGSSRDIELLMRVSELQIHIIHSCTKLENFEKVFEPGKPSTCFRC